MKKPQRNPRKRKPRNNPKNNQMKIISSLLNLRILTAILLLVSVKINLYSQLNTNKDIIFSHPVNYHPSAPASNYYFNQLFKQAVPETLNVYAVRVQFKPDNNEQTTGNGRFDVSSNYPDSVDAPPHDSLYFSYKLEFLKNYYYKASKGNLIINFTILPTVRNLSSEMEVYSPRRQENLQRLGTFFYDVWRSVDSAVDFTGIDPSKSAFMIFHAGVGRDVDLASSGLFVGELDLPSIYMSNSTLKSLYGDTTQGYYTNEDVVIPSSCMLPEQEFRIVNTTFGDIYLELGLNGIVVATIGSHLGLPDLFNTETGRTAIGRFGLMDGQAIFSYLGVFPPEPSAWEKQYLGWISPVTVSQNGTYTTKAATLDVNGNESVHKILISAKEYFLVENRNRDANGNGQTIYFVKGGVRDSLTYDKDIEGFNSSDIWRLKGSITDVDELDWSVPGLKNDTANYQGGILVWHIDENVIDAKFASNTINNDIEHKGVDVEEAKGSQDIGVVVSTPIGDLISDGFFVDFWYDGNHYRPSNIYRNEFNATTFPNSKSYTNINSRVCLSAFSQIGPSMTFTFENCGNLANISGFPRSVGIDLTGNAQPIGFDYNSNGFDEIFVNVKDSLYGFRDNGNPIRVDMPNGFLKDSAASFVVSYLFGTTTPQNHNIVGVYGNKINILYFTIDSLTSEPNILSYDAGNVNFTTPNIVSRDNSTISSGTESGKIGNLLLSGFNYTFDSVSNLRINQLANLPSVGFGYDFASGNEKYFVLGIFDDDTVKSVTIENDKVKLNGNIISGNLGITRINSSPVAADLNKDGQQDIIFTADNKVFAINRFGVLLDNFPFSIPGVASIESGCSVADLNGDGIFEVIFGTGDGRVYAYSSNGQILDGFPVITGSNIKSTPAIINSSGNFGIVVYSTDGYLYGFKTPWAYEIDRIAWKNYLGDLSHSNSNYSVAFPLVSGPCLPSDKVYNWPNPAYGKSTNIRYFLNADVTGISIKIMDLSGELVTTLAGTTNKGFDNEVPWDISNVSSGIYIAVLELSGGCSETASIKIAVVK
jgi:Secretion system C-terminal sorting domain